MIKTALFSIAFLFITAALSAQDKEKNKQLTVQLSKPGKDYTLSVSVLNGSVQVNGYNGKEIVIDLVGHDANMANTIAEEENNNNVVIVSKNRSPGFLIILTIPQNVKLKLLATGTGNISMSNLRGEFEINEINGNINLSKMTGSVVASIMKGNINADFISVSKDDVMGFSTFNGNVNVFVPPSTTADLKIDVARKYKFDTNFDVQWNKDPSGVPRTGKINGGGAKFFLKAETGNVVFLKNRTVI